MRASVGNRRHDLPPMPFPNAAGVRGTDPPDHRGTSARALVGSQAAPVQIAPRYRAHTILPLTPFFCCSNEWNLISGRGSRMARASSGGQRRLESGFLLHPANHDTGRLEQCLARQTRAAAGSIQRIVPLRNSHPLKARWKNCSPRHHHRDPGLSPQPQIRCSAGSTNMRHRETDSTCAPKTMCGRQTCGFLRQDALFQFFFCGAACLICCRSGVTPFQRHRRGFFVPCCCCRKVAFSEFWLFGYFRNFQRFF